MTLPFGSLEGKTVLVTGASSGLGRESAVLASTVGASLWCSGRDTRRLQDTLAALTPGNAHGVQASDLGTTAGVRELATSAPALDGLVYSAGFQKLSPLKQLQDEVVERMFFVNAQAPILLVKELLRLNKFRPGASIVLITSIAAHTGTEGLSLYSATKGALEGFIRPAALELARRRIRINTVASGTIPTPIYGDTSAERFAELETRYPLGLGTPQDMAATVVFLLSDAAAFITGTPLILDGGSTRI